MHGILYAVIFIRIFQCRTNKQSVFSHTLSGHRFCNGFHIESIVHFTTQRNRHLFCCFNIDCFAAKCLFDGFCSAIASLSQLRARFLFHLQTTLIDNSMGAAPCAANFDLFQNPITIHLFDGINGLLCKLRELLNLPKVVFLAPRCVRLITMAVIIAL